MVMRDEKRPRVRKAPEERREEILDAAGSVFLAEGVSGATMDQVAREAGIAKGTVYLYFESKDALVTGLLERYNEDLLRIGRERLEGAYDLAALEAFIHEVVDYHVEHADLLRVVFHSTSPHGAEFHQLRGHDLIQGFIERGIGAGAFDVPDVALATAYVFDGVHGVLNAAFHDRRPDRQYLVDTMTQLVGKTLSA